MTTVTKNRNKMADDVITRMTLTLMLEFYSIHLCGKRGPFYSILYGHKVPFFELGAIVTPLLLTLLTHDNQVYVIASSAEPYQRPLGNP